MIWLEIIIDQLKRYSKLKSTVVLHRSRSGVNKIKEFLDSIEYSTELMKSSLPVDYGSDSIKICTMSSIKGLEFNNVLILDLNENVIPYPPGFIDANDEFHISTERRLLYTCMTRAKNALYLLSSDKNNPSRFLKEIDPDLLLDMSRKDDDLPF
jgi:superfamily I DNA/RNA helicase